MGSQYVSEHGSEKLSVPQGCPPHVGFWGEDRPVPPLSSSGLRADYRGSHLGLVSLLTLSWRWGHQWHGLGKEVIGSC